MKFLAMVAIMVGFGAAAQVIRSPEDIKIRFLGCSRPDIAKKLTKLYQTTVWDGLKKIEKINPALAQQAYKKLNNREIKAKCEYSKNSGSGPWYDEDTDTMYLGVFTTVSGDRKILLQNTMFHETLHLLGWDNMYRDLHDDNATNGGLAGAAKDLDVVYACASYAYPDDRKGPIQIQLTVEERAHDILIACRTCAQGEFTEGGDRVVALLSSRERALALCKKVGGIPQPPKASPASR
jgi:hypothetical protein